MIGAKSEASSNYLFVSYARLLVCNTSQQKPAPLSSTVFRGRKLERTNPIWVWMLVRHLPREAPLPGDCLELSVHTDLTKGCWPDSDLIKWDRPASSRPRNSDFSVELVAYPHTHSCNSLMVESNRRLWVAVPRISPSRAESAVSALPSAFSPHNTGRMR